MATVGMGCMSLAVIALGELQANRCDIIVFLFMVV